jgi:hypothetical protein
VLGFHGVVARRQERHDEDTFIVCGRGSLEALCDADYSDVCSADDGSGLISYHTAERRRRALRMNAMMKGE